MMSEFNTSLKMAALNRMKRNARPGRVTHEEAALETYMRHERAVRDCLFDQRDIWETIRMYLEQAMARRSLWQRFKGWLS